MKTVQDAISDTEFADTFKESGEILNKIINKDHPDDLIPVLQVVCRDNFGEELQVHAFGLASFPDTHQDKAAVLNSIGRLVYNESKTFGSPVAVIFVSEAWTLAKPLSPAASKIFQESGKRVSEHKNKKEIIIIAGRTIDGRRAMSMHDIIRVNGNIDHLKQTSNSFESKGKAKELSVDTYLLDNFYKGVYEAATNKKGEN